MNQITVGLVILNVVGIFGNVCVAQQSGNLAPPSHRVTLDVFVREDSERCQELLTFLTDFKSRRGGLDVAVHDVDADPKARRCAIDLFRKHGIEKPGVPAVHVLNQFHVGFEDTVDYRQRIASLLDIEVFVRAGCPHCRDAKVFLSQLERDWPAIRIVQRDISVDEAARERLAKLADDYRVQATSVPAFHLCRRLKVGYQGASITGRELQDMLCVCAKSVVARDTIRTPHEPKHQQQPRTNPAAPPGPQRIEQGMLSGLTAWLLPQDRSEPADKPTSETADAIAQPQADVDQFDSFGELDMELSTEGVADPDHDATSQAEFDDVMSQPREEIQVPLFGRLNVNRLGLPAFTFLIGLVDGFNPCAMWVLMFLLSVLVNVKDRRKMLVIAGTFVVVSGLAYFAFMAAWLNVFMLVGLDRPAQIVLGIAATCIGLINVKDFFAFGSGPSLKIPESAKPGIYARVRKIITAQSLWGALTAAIVLAVLVNIIELLCTAGLPALYTEILTLQQLSPLTNYLYLGLYIVAYMLDDTILVAIVVVTLSKKKLQESHGRWLKLLSGIVILALGVIMLFAPTWLI